MPRQSTRKGTWTFLIRLVATVGCGVAIGVLASRGTLGLVLAAALNAIAMYVVVLRPSSSHAGRSLGSTGPNGRARREGSGGEATRVPRQDRPRDSPGDGNGERRVLVSATDDGSVVWEEWDWRTRNA